MEINKKSKTHRGESLAKRQTRSIHEKQRRQEMNDVLNEMMTLLPGVFSVASSSSSSSASSSDVINSRKTSQPSSALPKKPDKCFIIGSAVEFIRSAAGRLEATNQKMPSATLSEVDECFELTKCLIFELDGFLVRKARGDAKKIFGINEAKMIGKDFRSFLDFNSAKNFIFPPTTSSQRFKIQTSRGIFVNCLTRRSTPISEKSVVICIDDSQPPPPSVSSLASLSSSPMPNTMPKTSTTTTTTSTTTTKKPLSKFVEERPILAALLRSDLDATTTMTTTTETTASLPSLQCDTASTSSTSLSFLSPQSSSSNCATRNEKKESQKKTAGSRKRLRSVNVIVESYSLDDAAKIKDSHPEKLHPTLVSPPSTSSLNPYEVLTPGYRDIWLRLQSEQLLLQERVLAKERELQTLMFSGYSGPSTSSIPANHEILTSQKN